MSGDGEQQLSGPDLAEGIELSELGDGACLAGHAGGEAVLVVRRGDEIFAVGANCTHYGGPLADGLVVDDTVRCPWHHACFSLRTGEALRAPALNPLARYRVERQGGRVVVHEKLPPPPTPAAADGGETPSSVVVVGAGAAGNAAAERLRQLGYGGPITLVGADEEVPYDRPNLSKDYLAGNAPEEWIPLRSREFYQEQRIDLRLGTRVTALDPARREITLAAGADTSQLQYGALLLATGAEPVRLRLPGGDLPHVHYLRTLADSRAIIAAVAGAGGTDEGDEARKGGAPARAVVLGASFIGLEVAAALRARKLDVTVVERGAVPLAHAMGEEIGAFVRALHEEHGVVFRLGQQTTAIDAEAVTLESGERLPADLVVVGVGVKPALALAEAAGLATGAADKEGIGVLVDEYLQTSAPGIYAAGDIARWSDPHGGERPRVEHWVVAERQGQTAAANILGRREPFSAAPFFWSQHYDVQISYVGHATPGAGVTVGVDGSLAARDATVTFRDGDRVRAVATLGRDRQSLAVELALERGDDAGLQAALHRAGEKTS